MHMHLKLDKVDQDALKVSGLLLMESLQLLQCLCRKQPRGEKKYNFRSNKKVRDHILWFQSNL